MASYLSCHKLSYDKFRPSLPPSLPPNSSSNTIVAQWLQKTSLLDLCCKEIPRNITLSNYLLFIIIALFKVGVQT